MYSAEDAAVATCRTLIRCLQLLPKPLPHPWTLGQTGALLIDLTALILCTRTEKCFSGVASERYTA